MTAKNYREALDYLYGLTHSGIKLGLKNTRRLLRHFGDPQLKVRTIHIAGTNGKGSTAAFTESILRAAGYRVGLYTSPHLLDFRERIQIDRELIPQEQLLELILRVKQTVEELEIPVTYFEFGTVLAFLYFAERKVDWNVIEVGLGGRLDATNLCQPEISIITSIAQDHAQYLGADLRQIAFEKASIIKESGTVFAHLSEEEVRGVVRQMADEKSAKLYRLGEHFSAQGASSQSEGQTMNFSRGQISLTGLTVPLIGDHQVNNAALAVAACLELGDRGFSISEATVGEGLSSTRWEGRLEVAGSNPLFILDCAHNPESVKCLTKAIRDRFAFERAILLAGIMQDKPIDEMLAEMGQFADEIILVKPRQERSEDPSLLKTRLQKFYSKPITVIESIPGAVREVKLKAGPDDLICVTGSIFTVAEAKEYLANEANS